MKTLALVACFLVSIVALAPAQDRLAGLRGDPEAIAEAEAMVEAMGGREIWSQMKSLHFVHEWFFWNRIDSYVENEILDLTGPRSWIEMKSEIYHRLRAYSPEYKYWNVINGEFSFDSDEQSQALVEGAPFHIMRIVRGIAIGDPYYEVRFGEGEFRNSRQLEFFGPDGKRGSWIVLNARKEPVLWAVNEFKYTFGPMKRFGNLRVPNWAVTGNGGVTYEMISLTGSGEAPDAALFAPPEEYASQRKK